MTSRSQNQQSAVAAPTAKPNVIGIYGISGSGKSTLRKGLESALGRDRFEYFEGSEVLYEVEPGMKISKMSKEGKANARKEAIELIQQKCADTGKTGIVVGHLVLWGDEEIWTEGDAQTYTHIIYLAPSIASMRDQRAKDFGAGTREENRAPISDAHLWKWQEHEKALLRTLCQNNNIIYALVENNPSPLQDVLSLLRDITRWPESWNLMEAGRHLDLAMEDEPRVETMLVLDADKTLSQHDTGELFWKMLERSRGNDGGNAQATEEAADLESPLTRIFKQEGYTYEAFNQVAKLYDEQCTEEYFEDICDQVASAVNMYQEFVSLLQSLATIDHVGAVVVTCGLRLVWEKILAKIGLEGKVKVIGGGRHSNGYVVTPEVKTAVVARLQDKHHMFVWAFGDSPLDLGMMKKADQAIVVVGDLDTRSKSMEKALLDAIEKDGLQARQVVLPSDERIRLDGAKLPGVGFEDVAESVLGYRRDQKNMSESEKTGIFEDTGSNAAKLLGTPTRNADIFGPALQECHHRAGMYLATRMISDIVGVEEYAIPHVQGNHTNGHRFAQEKRTLIVAMMRAGEPLALGLHAAMPLAALLHAKHPTTEITEEYMKGRRSIVLADWVINEGGTVVEFIDRIRDLNKTVRIIMVAGVTQIQATQRGGFADRLKSDPNLYLVTLRTSNNKYKGKGSTDTGHRVFNTTFRD